MKILLLPGMDGTGLLFKPLLPLLRNPYIVFTFPTGSEHNYDSIYEHVKQHIPNEEFIVVAESFSGPLAARLIAENLDNLKGVVFVATFLSKPSPFLLKIAKNLPLKWALKLPFLSIFIRHFLLSNQFSIGLFNQALSQVSEEDLNARLRNMDNLSENVSVEKSNLPVLYLSADNDWLISKRHINDFSARYTNLVIHTLKGTHFLSQSNPQVCAQLINRFVDELQASKIN